MEADQLAHPPVGIGLAGYFGRGGAEEPAVRLQALLPVAPAAVGLGEPVEAQADVDALGKPLDQLPVVLDMAHGIVELDQALQAVPVQRSPAHFQIGQVAQHAPVVVDGDRRLPGPPGRNPRRSPGERRCTGRCGCCPAYRVRKVRSRPPSPPRLRVRAISATSAYRRSAVPAPGSVRSSSTRSCCRSAFRDRSATHNSSWRAQPPSTMSERQRDRNLSEHGAACRGAAGPAARAQATAWQGIRHSLIGHRGSCHPVIYCAS